MIKIFKAHYYDSFDNTGWHASGWDEVCGFYALDYRTHATQYFYELYANPYIREWRIRHDAYSMDTGRRGVEEYYNGLYITKQVFSLRSP